MEKIDLNKIRGRYEECDIDMNVCAGGDDTIKSIEIVAEKVNELIEKVNKFTE